MIKYHLMDKHSLDIILDRTGANALRENLNHLLEKQIIEGHLDLLNWRESGAKKLTLRLRLDSDDYINFESNQICLAFDQETCEYAIDKLNKFIDSGHIFPAELQSFENKKHSNNKNSKSIMVFFHSDDAYNAPLRTIRSKNP